MQSWFRAAAIATVFAAASMNLGLAQPVRSQEIQYSSSLTLRWQPEKRAPQQILRSALLLPSVTNIRQKEFSKELSPQERFDKAWEELSTMPYWLPDQQKQPESFLPWEPQYNPIVQKSQRTNLGGAPRSQKPQLEGYDYNDPLPVSAIDPFERLMMGYGQTDRWSFDPENRIYRRDLGSAIDSVRHTATHPFREWWKQKTRQSYTHDEVGQLGLVHDTSVEPYISGEAGLEIAHVIKNRASGHKQKLRFRAHDANDMGIRYTYGNARARFDAGVGFDEGELEVSVGFRTVWGTPDQFIPRPMTDIESLVLPRVAQKKVLALQRAQVEYGSPMAMALPGR